MAKAGKSIPSETEEGTKPKSKKLLFIIIGVLVLGGGGGAAWFFTKGSDHPAEVKAAPYLDPKFVALEPFTVNLQQDGGEKFLQIGITLKFTDPELEEKIKLHMPEIRSRILLLLSGKHAADLIPAAGKTRLAYEITAEASAVLGLPAPPAPPMPVADGIDASAVSGTPAESAPVVAEGAHAAPPAAQTESAPTEQGAATADRLEVLFTSFIIQ